jgi:hypothetical protein
MAVAFAILLSLSRAGADASESPTASIPAPVPGNCPASIDGPVARLRGQVSLWSEDALPELLAQLELSVHPLDEGGLPAPQEVWSRPLHALPRLSGATQTWAFEAEALPLGSYQVRCEPLGLIAAAEVLQEGGWCEIPAPRLARTLVEAFDPTGRELSVAAPGAFLLSAAARGFAAPRAFVSPTRAGFEVLSPPGRLRLETGLEGWRPGSTIVEVSSGWNHVALELRAIHLLSVDCTRRATPTTMPCGWWSRVEVEPASAVVGRRLIDVRSGGARELQLELAELGDFRLSFPALDDGTVPPPLLASVHADRPNMCRIEVVPYPSTPDEAR